MITGPETFVRASPSLLESLAQDARLSPSTDEEVVGVLRRRLAGRLRIEAWYKDHPEIEDLPVYGPVDVIGLPRTGTTALGSMLSLDPQLRSLRMWEQREPCPPPTLEGEAEDPRRLAYAVENDELPAEAKAMHVYEIDASVEDSDILGMGFHGQQFTLPVYGYHAWWRDADSTEAFAYHRRAIKLLQSQRPPYLWLFKAPHHKFHLEALLSAYPDARFLMTHRDPAKSVPSYASFVSSIFPAASGELDLIRLGREVSEHLRIGMENAMTGKRAYRRGPVPRRPPCRLDRRPTRHHPAGLRVPRLESRPQDRTRDEGVASGQPLGRPRGAHVCAIGLRAERRDRSAPITTFTSSTSLWRWRASDEPGPGAHGPQAIHRPALTSSV